MSPSEGRRAVVGKPATGVQVCTLLGCPSVVNVVCAAVAVKRQVGASKEKGQLQELAEEHGR